MKTEIAFAQQGARTWVARYLLTTALLTMAGPACAAVMVQDRWFSINTAVALPGAGSDTASVQQDLTYNLFDPSLGTLTAAVWELQSAYASEGSVTITSFSTNPNAPVTGGFTIRAGVDAGFNGLLGTGGQYFSALQESKGECVTTINNGPCTFGLYPSGALDGTQIATDFASLTGAGTFNQTVRAAVQIENTLNALSASISSSGFIIFADTLARGELGRLTLYYDYTPAAFTPVPEPSTVWMAVAGACLVAARRFRSR